MITSRMRMADDSGFGPAWISTLQFLSLTKSVSRQLVSPPEQRQSSVSISQKSSVVFASGVNVASLRIQLLQAVYGLKGFCESIMDAPVEIAIMMDELLLLTRV